MGFLLWLDRDLAWSQGTSEYRAMGSAVISSSDLFRQADFHPRRRPPVGLPRPRLYASLGAVNAELLRRRTKLPLHRAQ